jgi:transposase
MRPKFTVDDFKRMYQTDAACLDTLFKIRYGKLEACPACACPASFRRITTRRCYQCKHCYSQFYPTQGTVFENTHVALHHWFHVMYLFTTTRNGLAAKEVQRIVGCTYKTAWRMGHQIRTLIGDSGDTLLKGFIEMDETYVGGKSERAVGRNTTEKAPVFAMVERQGRVKAFQVKNVQKQTVYPLIQNNVSTDSIVNTDEFKLYANLKKDLGLKEHNTINHSMKVYRIGSASTNTIEGYFSQLKRMIYGTHLHVSPQHLQKYVQECNFRYNNRKNQDGMFALILSNLPEKKMN